MSTIVIAVVVVLVIIAIAWLVMREKNKCQVNSDCGPGEYCSTAGQCASGCQVDTDCTGGKICVNGQCAPPQCTPPCASGQFCKAGICAGVNLRPNTITDCGNTDRARGWYDIQGQGVRNDFCRYPTGNAAVNWFSCELANGSSVYPNPNAYTPSSAAIHSDLPHDALEPYAYGC